MKPLCFVLMPFGTKKDPGTGLDIDFNHIYETAIRIGVEAAGMEPIRADEERTGGIIHKAMFERLMLCDFAVADLTTANANVFYELGVRHTVRPATTLPIFWSGGKLPFDVDFLRALPYSLSDGNRFGDEEASLLKRDLAHRLEELRKLRSEDGAIDSPVFHLLKGYRAPDIARLKTDVFRERTRYAAGVKNTLARARAKQDGEGIRRIESSLGPLENVESGVLVDLFLSYRAVEDWDGMVALYDAMPAALRKTVLVREQVAGGCSRRSGRDEALEVLEDILDEQGTGSETCGLIGRVYKDCWCDSAEEGKKSEAAGYLDRAIAMYRRGFEADSRDAYPGVNAVTLLDIKGDAEALELKAKLLPVVRYAVERRLESSRPDYWDHATMLELAVLADDLKGARTSLSLALTGVRESWEPKTTAGNLRLIRKARADRGVDVAWLEEIIEQIGKTR